MSLGVNHGQKLGKMPLSGGGKHQSKKNKKKQENLQLLSQFPSLNFIRFFPLPRRGARQTNNFPLIPKCDRLRDSFCFSSKKGFGKEKSNSTTDVKKADLCQNCAEKPL